MRELRQVRARWSLLIALALVIFGSVGARCGRSTEIPDAEVVRVGPGFVPGDELTIDVFGEEELSGDFQVQDDGTLDFPLVGRLEVEGMTQSQFAKDLETRLADGYLRDPQVKVRVTSRQNLEVSVLGQVTEPGTFPFVENLTLVQAISGAGGMTPLAASHRVKLTRHTKTGRKTFEVSVKAIIESRAEDLQLQPGDIVFVPESAI